MKKSTILLVIVVYIVSFFIVGFMGIQLRSAYSVSYINEIRVEPTEQTEVTLKEDKKVTHGDESDPKTYSVTHDYKYFAMYKKGMSLVFNVIIVPENSTVSEYQWDHDPDSEVKENDFYIITKDSVDKTLTITPKKNLSFAFTTVTFSLWDSDQNGVKTNVSIDIM